MEPLTGSEFSRVARATAEANLAQATKRKRVWLTSKPLLTCWPCRPCTEVPDAAANKDASPQKDAARRWVFAPYGVPWNNCRDLNSGLSWTMDCRERQSARLSANSKMCLPVICLVLLGWEGRWPACLLIGMPSVIIVISVLQQPVPAFHCSLIPAWGVARGRRGSQGGGRKPKGRLGVRTALSRRVRDFFFPLATNKRCPGPALPKSQTVISLRCYDRPT